MHNHSYENEFNLHVNEISFSYEKMGTKTRFEEEAKGNSEMVYCHLDEFTQSSGYKLSVLFTVYSFQFLIKFGGTLFHDFSLISLPQCLLDKVSILQEESKSSSLLLQSNQVKRAPHD